MRNSFSSIDILMDMISNIMNVESRHSDSSLKDYYENEGPVLASWSKAISILNKIVKSADHTTAYETFYNKTVSQNQTEISRKYTNKGKWIMYSLISDFGSLDYPSPFRNKSGEAGKVQNSVVNWGCSSFPTDQCGNYSLAIDFSDLETLIIDPNVKEGTFCRAMELYTESSPDLWYKFRDYYNSPRVLENVQEASLVRKTLACTDDDDLLLEYLELSLDEDFIRTQDAWYIYQYVSNRSRGQILAYEFLKDNYARVEARLRSRLDRIIGYVSREMNSEEEREDLQEFEASLPSRDQELLSTAFQTAYSTIDSNINWRETYESALLQG